MTTEASEGTVMVVDPRTGVAFQPEKVSNELLVEIYEALKAREERYQQWRRQAEDELVRRAETEAGVSVAGRSIDVKRSWARRWDGVDLVSTAEDLVERGLLRGADIAGLATWEQRIDGRKAAALLERASPEALKELRGCFRWEEKGRARIEITRPEIERET